MTKFQSIPLGRILGCLPEKGTWYAPAYQGTGGLFAIRGRDNDGVPLFQVCRLFGRRHKDPEHDRSPEDVSEPWMTYEGADQFAQRLAGGGESRIG